MSLIRHRRKTFLLCKIDWNAKVGRDACGNRQGISGPFWNDNTNERGHRLLEFASFNDLVLSSTFTVLVITKHPEDGPGKAQVDNTTTRLNTFWWGSASDQEWAVPEHEVFQKQTLEVIMSCWWWPSTFTWKKSASQNTQDSSFTSKSWKIPMYWKPSKLWYW